MNRSLRCLLACAGCVIWGLSVGAQPTGVVVTRMTTAPVILPIQPPPEPPSIHLYRSGVPALEGAQSHETWNSILGHKLVRNVTQPTLTPFLPQRSKATGAGVIVAPGGGFVS